MSYTVKVCQEYAEPSFNDISEVANVAASQIIFILIAEYLKGN